MSPRRRCISIYCEYSRREEQTTVALLSNILQQLLQESTDDVIMADARSLYELHKRYDTRPTITQISDLLCKFVAKLQSVHVFVDALDECTESEAAALQFVSAVRALGSQVKILCTSRFSTTFAEYFNGCSKMVISAQSDDLRTFADAQIETYPRLAKHVATDTTLKDLIVNTIITESQGM